MLRQRTRSFLAVLIALVLAPAGWSQGAVIIGGDDADDHGSFSGGNNQAGWFYIEEAFNNLGPAISNGNMVVACVGCNGSSKAQTAFASGFDESNLPGAGWTRVSLTSTSAITAFFDGTGATNVNNTGILYMPTDSANISGGITATQLALVNSNAAALNTFVSGGGGLFAHDQSSIANGFDWLTTLVPGIVNNDEAGCDLDYVANTGRSHRIETALCNCIAFGSKNSALVFKKYRHREV